MSRNIPAVRRWRVTYRSATSPLFLACVYVDAPTARLAKWEARDKLLLQMGADAFVIMWRKTAKITAWRLPHRNWPL